MPEDWNSVAGEVAEAIGDVGHTAMLIRDTGVTGPEWDQSHNPPTEIPVKLLGDALSIGLVDLTAVQYGDRREMMAAEGVAPDPADRLRIGDTTYAIIRAEPYAPGGVPLYFDLILRA